MTFYTGNLIRHFSALELTPGVAPTTKAYLDWLTDCKPKKVATQNTITGYKGVSNEVTDISEVNHYWQWEKDLYFRYNGYSVASLFALLANSDTLTGSSSPYTHSSLLAPTTNLVKPNHSWFDDASAVLQECPQGVIESWALDWDTSQGNITLKVIEDTFAPINQSNQSGIYVAPPSGGQNLTSVSSINAGRVSRPVDVLFKIYNSAGTPYTAVCKVGNLTLTRATSAFFGGNLNSVGSPATDPLNPDAFVSMGLTLSGQLDLVYDGNLTGTVFDDMKLFKELVGPNGLPHKIVINDPTSVYSLEFDLGPIRIGDATYDRSQNPVTLSAPFSSYTNEDAASGNGSVGISSFTDTTHVVLPNVPASLTAGALVQFTGGTSPATDNAKNLTVQTVTDSTHIVLSGAVTNSDHTGLIWSGGTPANNLLGVILKSPLNYAIC